MSTKQQSLKKDFAWNTLGVLAQNALSPLLLLIITRINGIHFSGIFSYAFAVAVILWAFGLWGGRIYQVSDVKREYDNSSYVIMRVLLALCMLVFAIGFCVANQYNFEKSIAIILLTAYKAIESIADSLYGAMQINSRLYNAGLSLLFKTVSSLVVFTAIDLVTKNIFAGIVSIVAVNVAFLLFYDITIVRRLERVRFNKFVHHVYKSIEITKRTAPIFAVSFMSMFSINIPRYFLDRYHEGQIAYFGIMAMPITLIVLLISFIIEPNVVKMAQAYHSKVSDDFRKISGRIMAWTLGVGLVMLAATVVLGVPTLNLVFGIPFGDYKMALIIMVAGGVINALVSVSMYILTITRHFKVQFYTLLFTNIALVPASYFFVKRYGLDGSAILFMIINIIQLVILSASYGYSSRKNLKTFSHMANPGQ